MQQGLRCGDAKYDLDGVVERIDRLAGRVRARGGRVLFVQHDGSPDDGFVPHSPGWRKPAMAKIVECALYRQGAWVRNIGLEDVEVALVHAELQACRAPRPRQTAGVLLVTSPRRRGTGGLVARALG